MSRKIVLLNWLVFLLALGFTMALLGMTTGYVVVLMHNGVATIRTVLYRTGVFALTGTALVFLVRLCHRWAFEVVFEKLDDYLCANGLEKGGGHVSKDQALVLVALGQYAFADIFALVLTCLGVLTVLAGVGLTIWTTYRTLSAHEAVSYSSVIITLFLVGNMPVTVVQCIFFRACNRMFRHYSADIVVVHALLSQHAPVLVSIPLRAGEVRIVPRAEDDQLPPASTTPHAS